MAKYCLKCKTRTEVLSTRYVPEKNHIRRIRICKNCGYKFITHEQEYKRKKNLVLIFFPYNLDFDGNMQILKFNERYEEFRALNTEILAIGNDFCYIFHFVTPY